MEKNIIQHLASHEIYQYGSVELLKFESQMERYFTREYERWSGNKTLPENYGVSSFEGDIANRQAHAESIDHYNKELRIYQAFLDKYMVYTMAYYGASNQLPEVNTELSLEQAQIDKYNLIIERADIQDGQTILELGCGFGGFASYLLEVFPEVKITGINPSVVQSGYLQETLPLVNSSFDMNRFTLVSKFFDELVPGDIADNHFDRVVSIGVLEAVTNLDKLFELISRVLKPGGKTFHHFIVSVDTIPRFLNADNSLMADYFPGGHIWPFSEPMRHDNHLAPVSSWFVNGLNYWKTLDEWHKRFWNSIEALYPEYMTLEEVRDWNRYFTLCKTMFSPNQGRSYGNGHYLYEKPADGASLTL